MKHPFWIVNSTLLALTCTVFAFMYFTRVAIPEREEIEPAPFIHPKKEETLEINISKIYENDLFGTFQKELPPAAEPDYTIEFPEPPAPQPVEIPELPAPQFLEPMTVTLKGIFTLSNDSSRNRAIIQDNNTNLEASYRVGDTIGDAQLIRIFPKKIVFLRANGQQEVIYLREQDAKSDTAFNIIDGWENVAQQVSENNYVISPTAFMNRIQNLGHFIEILNLTTAYKAGRSFGCRIGQLDENSFGTHLGLVPGDIILSINGIPATTIENRLQIYKNIVSASFDDTIEVMLLRNKQEREHSYTLKDFSHEELSAILEEKREYFKLQRDEKEAILKEKYEFAPTLKQIREREKKNMLEKAKEPASIAPGETK